MFFIRIEYNSCTYIILLKEQICVHESYKHIEVMTLKKAYTVKHH